MSIAGFGAGDSGRKVIVNPVTVQWDANLGVDEAFEAIMSRKRSAEKRNYIKGLLDYTGLLLKYEVDAEMCTGCTLCFRNCPVGAITGEKKMPHYINQSLCIKCGVCYDKCKFKAISIV